MKGYLFLLLLVIFSCTRIPKYFVIDDNKTILLKNVSKQSNRCDTLAQSTNFSNSESLYILFLFSVNYVNEAGKGENRYFQPGGYGDEGILKRIKSFNVYLVGSDSSKINVTDKLHRSLLLNSVYTKGNSFLNYLYDKDCEPLGMSIISISELTTKINDNDRAIHYNNLVNSGIALALDLKMVNPGAYTLKTEIEFLDYSIVKSQAITID